MTTAALTVERGRTTRLEIAEPVRALETPGVIGADLHVHSAESFDSAFPLERQLQAFTALGGEVMVASEHDRVFDPRPTVHRLGLAERLVAIVGVEATSAFAGGTTPHTIGHLNAFRFPTGATPPAAARRAPRGAGSGTCWPTCGLPRPPLVQLNHPREKTTDQGRTVRSSATSRSPAPPSTRRAPSRPEPNRNLLERGARRACVTWTITPWSS